MKNDKKIINLNVIIAGVIGFLFVYSYCFGLSWIYFPNRIYYIFNKDKEKILIDDNSFWIEETKDYDDYDDRCGISSELCEVNENVKSFGFGVYQYNSFSKPKAVLNDKYVLKAKSKNENNTFLWKKYYRTNYIYFSGDLSKIKLKNGRNKIVISGNATAKKIYFMNNN